jgi:hypothetical protein
MFATGETDCTKHLTRLTFFRRAVRKITPVRSTFTLSVGSSREHLHVTRYPYYWAEVSAPPRVNTVPTRFRRRRGCYFVISEKKRTSVYYVVHSSRYANTGIYHYYYYDYYYYYYYDEESSGNHKTTCML